MYVHGRVHSVYILLLISEFVHVLVCIMISQILGEVPVSPVRDGYLCLRVSCLRIQRGCECEKVSRYATSKRALKSHRLSETLIVWRNTSDTFTPRGLGYNSASCELVKYFELKESGGELRRFCLHQQLPCLQPCARLVISWRNIFRLKKDRR